jgi:bifunctional non-homologous end joining protein LigD
MDPVNTGPGHAERMAGAKQQVEVEGRRITLSNLDKVLYPATGTTKGDVIAYYAAIAPHMIPHLRDRPVTRKRWVDGVGTDEHPGKMFFQKDLDAHTPEWVLRRAIQHRDHANDYPLANDVATLTWLGQIAALELHVPQWRFGRTGDVRRPDRLVLDLDPGPGAGLPECVEVAKAARAILRDMGLEPYPVTSGSKGIHLYAALDGSHDADRISEVAHELARALEADHPDLVVSDMRKALRTGKVLVDWSQNNPNKTTVAPYSLRGRSLTTRSSPACGSAGIRSPPSRRATARAWSRRPSASRASRGRTRPTTASPPTGRSATRPRRASRCRRSPPRRRRAARS